MILQALLLLVVQSTTLKSYFDEVASLLLIIGGVIGFVGGLRIYANWNNRDGFPVVSELGNWIYGALILCIIGGVIKVWFKVA
ncbi:MAG: DUF4134 family protein [Flavobacteriaceae bacterium]|nr:DUF4134 family protein [Flavobacteriaceae bacterium]MCY4216599.1 DUF4134 family protein [Flavobacteriaceae bacterium]MCY4253506.1 DUF4134 family protein [Flavobacteriaceae bacterium]